MERLRTYSSQDALCFRVDIVGETEGIVKNFVIHNVDVFVVEWRKATEHLIKQYA
jgi:hypothetical protein